MNARNLGATVLGFAVAAAILAALAAVVGVEDVLLALEQGQPAPIVLVACAILGWLCFWGMCLRTVLAAVGARIGFREAVLVHAGVVFANNVTPFGQVGGEPIAAWLLADVSEEPIERTLAAVTSFDAINVVPSLTLAMVGLAVFATESVVGDRLQLLALGVVGFAFGATLLGTVLWRYRRSIEGTVAAGLQSVVPPASRVLPGVDPVDGSGIVGGLRRFIESVEHVAADDRRLVTALCLSAAGWTSQAVGLWLALSAFGADVPLYVPLFVVPLATIASVLPTPGGRGGIETAQVSLLALATSVPAATIAASVTVFTLGGFLFATSVGGASIVVLRLRDGSVGVP